jgi:RNA polymerase sigma factor (sigma-70 family)
LGAALSTATDAVLAEMAALGNAAAFGELVRRSLAAVRSLLRRMGAQPSLADDLAQDAFMAASRSIGTYRAESSFAAWVMRIAARLYVKRCRKDARWFLIADPLPDAATVTADAGALWDLDKALAELSAPERLCVSLCHGAGFTHDEIAQELQMPVGTVKSHVLRGLKKLRLRLEEGST